jgi:hypothetical protein
MQAGVERVKQLREVPADEVVGNKLDEKPVFAKTLPRRGVP